MPNKYLPYNWQSYVDSEMKTWSRVQGILERPFVLSVRTGRILFQSPECPDGVFIREGDPAWYIVPHDPFWIMAIEYSVILWERAIDLGITCRITHKLDTETEKRFRQKGGGA